MKGNKFLYWAVFVCFLVCSEAKASHLMGGEVTYTYLDAAGPSPNINRYKITFNLYTWCGAGSSFQTPPASISVGVYYANNGTEFSLYTVALSSSSNITPNLPTGCSVSGLNGFCAYYATYEQIINLPVSFSSFYVAYSECCRNADILNLTNPSGIGQTIYTKIPATAYQNSSPVFSDTLVPYLCNNILTSFINSATDPDGDQLVYSFTTPYNQYTSPFFPPPPSAIYSSGYSLTNPFGAGGYAYINAATGLTTFKAPTNGNFVISIQIKEYRTLPNSTVILLNTTNREIQFIVGNCPVNISPVPVGNTITDSVFNINSGSNLCFNITFSDSGGDSLALTKNGNPLGNNPIGNIFNGSLFSPPAILANANGSGFVSSQFCWNTVCNQKGTYMFRVNVTDNGCPPITIYKDYTINIIEPSPPGPITGPASVCSSQSGVVYSVPFSPGSIFQWTITGGTQISGGNSNSITVNWGIAGSGAISVVNTNVNGCISDSVDLPVAIVLNPANAGPDVAICIHDSTTLSAFGGVSYSWSPVAGLNSPSSATTIAKPLITTSYILTVTNSNGCINYDTVVLTVNNPVANAGADISVCSGNSTNLGVIPTTGLTYSWSPPTGLNSSSISNPTITLSNSGTTPIITTYTVTATLNGCISKDTVIITVKPLPISNAGADVSFCSGSSVSIGTAATAGYTYSWSPSSGLSSINTSDPILMLMNNDTVPITITYIATSILDGCLSQDSVKINVKELPLIVASDSWVCSGDSTILTATGGVIYNWSPSKGLNDSTLASPIASPVTTTTYVVIAEGLNGCINSDTISVVVGQIVPVNAGNDRSICYGDSTILGGAPTSPSGSVYFWTPSTGLNNVNIGNPIAKPFITTTYIVFVSNDTCKGVDTVTVNVTSLPAAITGNDKSICLGQSTIIGSDSIVGNSYYWTSQPGGFSSPFSETSVSPTITATYYLTETNIATGCSNYDSIKIMIMPLPAALTGNDTSVCEGDSVSIGSDSVSGNSYFWTSFPSGFASSLSTLHVSPAITTVYYLHETNITTGCFKNDSVTINIKLVPSAPNAGSNSAVCEGDTILLTAVSSSVGSYNWLGAGGFVSTNQNPSIANASLLNEGIYWLTTTVNGCTSPADSISVIIHLLSIVDAGLDQLVCIGTDSITLNGSSIGGNNSFLWTSSGSGSFFSDNNILNTTYVISNADSIAGSFNLLLSSANNTACPPSVDTLTITIGSIPYVSAGNDQDICADISKVLLNDSITGGSGMGVWSILNGSGTFITDSASSIIYNPASTDISNGTVTLIYTSINSCVNKSDTMVITIMPLPIADFSISNNNPFINQEISFTDESTNAFTWYWIFGAAPNTSNVQNPVYSFGQPGNYPVTLIIISDKGCKDTIVKYIDIKPFPLVVPSGFTPNGDNVNDVLFVRGGPFKQLEFKIYNEWGNLIFVSNIQSDGWDGTYKGVIQPSGVFVYTVNGITMDNESIKLSGEVNLIH